MALSALLDPVIRDKQQYGLKLQPPCSQQVLDNLQKRVQNEFATEPDAGYLSFLRITNGLDYNGLVVFACTTTPIVGYRDRFISGVVEANQGLRDVAVFKNYLAYATSGEVHYAYRLDTKQFVIIDAVSLDQFEAFDTFEQLLAAALKEQSQA